MPGVTPSTQPASNPWQLDAVMRENGITDRGALLQAAEKLRPSAPPDRAELERAAPAVLATFLPGYRWDLGDLKDVLAHYGLSDARPLLQAAARLSQSHTVSKSQLASAAQQLIDADIGRYRWSPSVLSQVMRQDGIADRRALLHRAMEYDADQNHTLQRSELEAAAKALTGKAPEVGIISDLDKTIIPPCRKTLPQGAYPGVAALMRELELRDDGKLGDMHYVTARRAGRTVGVAGWLHNNGLPAGDIESGVPGGFGAAIRGKVANIEALLKAHPNQRFVFFGDTAHVDPYVYRAIMRRYPDRVVAVLIHNVRKLPPDRVAGMHLFNNYAEAAAQLYGLGQLSEGAARRVMSAAQLQGENITDADIDQMLAAARQNS